MRLKAPFPYAGGKSRAADVIWRGLGPDVVNYVEPFAGSLATLLLRPGGAGKIETVNDIDGGIANFWRAVTADPVAVAEWCNWPVSELDLHARHAWLIERLDTLRDALEADPDFYDAKVAGWWVWGICQWIGTGWCGGVKRGRPRPNLNDGQGVHAPKVVGSAEGKPPRLDGIGKGVHRSRPHVSGADDASGSGVFSARLPGIGNDRGINGVSAPPCLEWFDALAVRLRRVRVVCGDWKRVLGPSVLGKGRNVGGRRPCAVFLDPPYDADLRTARLYTYDEPGLSAAVREWALEHGDDPDLRIVLAGYLGEHGPHMPESWAVHRWKGARGYAADDNENREQETLWFSPHCLPLTETQTALSFEVPA